MVDMLYSVKKKKDLFTTHIPLLKERKRKHGFYVRGRKTFHWE
jgi:hypothetical protein